MKILLKQQGKRILLDTSEYELYTDKSKDYSEIVNYLVNSLTHSRGIFHVSSSHKCKFYSGDILSKEYSIKDQEIREGANKRGNSPRLTQSFHFFMFEPIFSPVNASNQPI